MLPTMALIMPLLDPVIVAGMALAPMPTTPAFSVKNSPLKNLLDRVVVQQPLPVGPALQP